MRFNTACRASALFLSAVLSASCATQPASQNAQLELELFVSEPDEINVVSALIIGPTEMMVVSAQGTKSAANRLADRIEETDRTLRYIFLTHPHFDHHQGASVLKARFPMARFVASPDVARLQRVRAPMDDEQSRARLGANAAVPYVLAEDYPADTIEIDGVPIELWRGIIGDAGLGYPDEPHTALYIPSLNALLPSDAVYHDAHVFLGGSSRESRMIWSAQLEGWLAREFEIVVPGHMAKTSLETLSPEVALSHTRNYIATYEAVLAESETSDQLIAAMIEKYPDIRHRQGLYLGAFFDFFEFRSMLIDKAGNVAAGPGPASPQEAEAQRRQFEAVRRAYNPPDRSDRESQAVD